MEEFEFRLGDKVRVIQRNGGRKDVIKEGIVIETFKDAVRVCDPKETAEISNLKFCEVFPHTSPIGLGVELIGRPTDKDRKTMQEILKWV